MRRAQDQGMTFLCRAIPQVTSFASQAQPCSLCPVRNKSIHFTQVASLSIEFYRSFSLAHIPEFGFIFIKRQWDSWYTDGVADIT
jgi:hypothetical protein